MFGRVLNTHLLAKGYDHPEVFFTLYVLTNFMGKRLCRSLFFSKVAGLHPAEHLVCRLSANGCFRKKITENIAESTM